MEEKTLTQFILEEQSKHPGATGDLTLVLNDIATSCKAIANGVGQGALAGVLGSAGSENVQGETQKKMDIISNEIMLNMNTVSGHIKGMASEEMEEIQPVPANIHRGDYLLIFDPLDGSSNMDVNISVGTIFSVLKAPEGTDGLNKEDFLQPGTEQVCAGYALYGPSTMLVLTLGDGVYGFTLNRGMGEFLMTHPKMSIPADTQEFAINMSNMRFWEPAVKRYIEECLQGKEGVRDKDFNMRWVASMVAEVHRILTRGGIFMYPIDEKIKSKNLGGKLRLMYEANPMSLIVEQAGGLSSTGRERILGIQPQDIHQRVPVILGSKNEVERVVGYHQDSSTN